MPFRIGPWELGLILLIILMVFGLGKLPAVGDSIGKAIRAFRKEQGHQEDEEATGAARGRGKAARKTV
ncbi:MAG: twin-arginine translocase TatA/TatE family subunit [Chloroflexi bacterium]|nr:twin-arginine translocase TatA/TatE family subunit [Chloroflexota bacterium]